MDQETKYSFSDAHKSAEYIVKLLRPHCEKIHIAGSIRRMRPDVKDIEIVCQPKKETKYSGLFQEESQITDRNFTEALATITDIIMLGNVDGRYIRIRTNSKLCPGIYLDLFMPDPIDYFRMYAIRTGSADYAHHVIAGAWRRKGWTGVSGVGLRLISECDCHTGTDKKRTYTVKKDLVAVTLPPVWESEADLFKWLGIPWIDPEQREFNKPINTAL